MVALDDFSAAPHHRQDVTSASSHWRICAVLLFLFIVAATLSAMRKDVTQGFDEVAHASYVAQLQQTGQLWPRFEDLRMLDPSSFAFTSQANYLNHPSPYYFLLARLGPVLEGHPEAIFVHRLFNVALVAIGLAALMAMGIAAGLPRLSFYAYIIPIAAIPVLAPLAGAVNNDNAAFAGGGIATLATFQLLVSGNPISLLAALVGLIVASWAKFTGLLLVGGLVGGALLWMLWRGRLQPRWTLPIAIAVLLASAPYFALLAQYGSPTPSTPGVVAMIKTGAQSVGWDSAERLTPLAFAAQFVSEFTLQWLPALKPRSALNYAALAIPVAAVLLAFGGFLVALRRISNRTEGPLDILTVTGALAFTATFIIHGIFSYKLHSEFGWLTTAYPRYYLPLAAIVPLAGLSLLGAIKQPLARTTLVVFLITGPLIFRLLGTPWG